MDFLVSPMRFLQQDCEALSVSSDQAHWTPLTSQCCILAQYTKNSMYNENLKTAAMKTHTAKSASDT